MTSAPLLFSRPTAVVSSSELVAGTLTLQVQPQGVHEHAAGAELHNTTFVLSQPDPASLNSEPPQLQNCLTGSDW